MKSLLIFSFIMFFLKDAECQNQKTKDGVSLGERADFISACTKAAQKESMNIKGFEVNTLDYCTCVYDKLIPTLYSDEINAAIQNKTMNELFFNDKNLKILIDCFRRNSNIDQNLKFNDFDDSSGFSKKIAITTCIKGIMEDSIKSKTWSKKTAESYCTCAVENLYAKGYTFKDIGRQPNQNNKLYNEVIAPCFNQALKDGTEINNLNNYHSEDIVGDYFSSKVSLLDYFKQGYKIKISVGGKVKYYLFDTGQAI